MPYYGVHRGRSTGVFTDWAIVQKLITGYGGPKFKKFKTKEEAEYFYKHGELKPTVYKDPDFITQDETNTNILFSDLLVYTDGSASSKTKKAAIGIAFSGSYEPYDHSEQLPNGSTNQLAELYAIAKALEIIAQRVKQKHDITTIEIWTDSDYSVKCAYQWGDNWEKNGWTTGNGDEVKYQTYIEFIRMMLKSMGDNVKLRHIKELNLKSHQSEPSDMYAKMVWKGNKRADVLARKLTI
jgi:ribonuclease HI